MNDNAGVWPIAGRGRSLLGALGIGRHVVLPLSGLLIGSLVLMQWHGDQAVASALYAMQGHQWAWKDQWLTEQLIHTAGRDLSITAGLLVLLLAIIAEWWTPLAGWRRPLLRLFASVVLSTVVVSLLKKSTGMDCPWDLIDYGGTRPFHGLFASRSAGTVSSGCFPAGHASAGYAWMALYFLALEVRPRLRHLALGLGAGLGLLFGLSQQLRGAHFMSHDLWTAGLCWFIALGLYLLSPPLRYPTPAAAVPLQSG
ncbi:phosphatase PAP2 family protein [Stenotrophomonas sp. WHRI 8082]|uniref:phosphatase PAP2 family protein n=1 Tax=Stenotrophomonas sp. WHRI 8082 TaxID=3162571 RepID=UPI0032EE0606